MQQENPFLCQARKPQKQPTCPKICRPGAMKSSHAEKQPRRRSWRLRDECICLGTRQDTTIERLLLTCADAAWPHLLHRGISCWPGDRFNRGHDMHNRPGCKAARRSYMSRRSL